MTLALFISYPPSASHKKRLQSFDLQAFNFLSLLPDKGSNLDIQIQNLSYYHYTIGQWEGEIK